jgi:hypothetical protein
MSTDRGTLQQESAAAQQQSWQPPTMPAGRRPPSAPRERKPVLAVLALVLIAGGALAAGYLINQGNKKVPAIEISRPLTAGEHIPLSAMQEVQVSTGSGVNYVPWNEASQVSQFYASAAIPPGTLLNGAMVVRAGNVATRKAILGLALKDGQLPDGLQVGDHVDVFQVSDSQNSCPGAPGQLLDVNDLVVAIRLPSQESGSSAAEFVEVAATPVRAGAIACSAANGNIAIAIAPVGTRAVGPGGAGSTTAPQPGATLPAATPSAGQTSGAPPPANPHHTKKAG